MAFRFFFRSFLIILAFAITIVTICKNKQGVINSSALLVNKDKSKYITNNKDALYKHDFIPTNGLKSVHSASLTQLDNGNLMAVWFSGTREGAKDVAIYSSVFSNEMWSKPKVVVDRDKLSQDLGRYISKVGNPVIMSDSTGRVWLFVVSVSVGGWTGSSINMSWSDNNGKNWSSFKRLITSPFMNIGTLVRSTPLEYKNGNLLLPAYHETIANFPQILTINREGDVIANTHIYSKRSMQPSICYKNNKNVFALIRNSQDSSDNRKILISESNNAGIRWSKISSTNMDNPHSSVACIASDLDKWLVVANNHQNNRSKLSLAISNNPLDKWEWIHEFENKKNGRFSYPSVIRDKQGYYHLLYTWNRKKIKHIIFNQSWINSFNNR